MPAVLMNSLAALKSPDRLFRDVTRGFSRLPQKARIGLGVAALFLVWLLVVDSPSLEPERVGRNKPKLQPNSVSVSPGGDWGNFNQIFAFGDSWSTIAFNVFEDQPDERNPFGNPGLPQNGSTHPPNYLQFLTTTYNASFLRTYIIAEGAATIDRDVVPPHENLAWTKPFKEQVNDKFAQFYHSGSPLAAWEPRRTLFTVWFGVVDVSLLVDRKTKDKDITARNIASYASTVDRLYDLGARHFLFLTVPPMYLSPSAREEGHDPTSERALITEFNDRMGNMRKEFLLRHADATAYIFDVHGLLSKVISSPESVVGAEHLRNTTDACFTYNPDIYQEVHPWDWYEAECGIALDQYFWANPLHPTHTVHNLTAAAIVSDCMGRVRTGFCS